ncbi:MULTISPECIES: argininosuccinate lyase [Petrotoga]|uniref:Argininosuccinate lyase n=2 Tax=Petrotoga sibirica TaxID=156202 RepID=A0A4R8EX67_9BACT|nr:MULTISPECIES: argininosuccinate lyase [Petrotoga]POZ88049.1 argininosuccinate lyase [Petrotoga sibirica DSM 13575]POZ90140.1 argininosuccinate lyase [Petrotoga sp. SL27]TDX17149.1 argininosuccinate lyase [Petrotoga sibirica]
MKLWGGRFKEKIAEDMEIFNSSINVDIRLLPYDIEASLAHAKGLKKAKIITDEEFEQIERALREIKEEKFEEIPMVEDVHTLVEQMLVEKIGDVGKKIHTARSRNDQIATDERLYLRDEILKIIDLLEQLNSVLLELSKKYKNKVMPGYTHLQRAQPITFSHHLLSYVEMFRRDINRLEDSLKRVNVLILGSGALAGTSYDIDRMYVASLLGFKEVSLNSMDGVSDRDFIIEFLSIASLIMMHLSRFSEEIVIWSTQEFNFVELSDKYSTGSSIMPQKKNPDSSELIRGKTGRVYGNLFSLLTTMKGLPLAYNKDMQEDKEPMFDTVDTLKSCLKVFIGMLETMRVNEKKMEEAVKFGYLNATDLADYLVKKGIPFRTAHDIVGKLVVYAITKNVPLEELNIAEFRNFCQFIDEDVYEVLDVKNILKSRKTIGAARWEAEI